MTKKINKKAIVNLALLAMFSAIIAAMTFTPYVGYITIPGMLSITTVHIIVIIAAICLNSYSAGAVIGLVWGVCCIIYASVNGTADATIFLDPRISIVPRFLVGILIVAFYKLALLASKKKLFAIILKCFTIVLMSVFGGLLCYNISSSNTASTVAMIIIFGLFIYLFFFGNKTQEAMPILFAAVCGTFSNTALVLSAISLFGGNGLIQLTGTLKNIYSTVVALNGTIEIIAAAVISIPCCMAIKSYMKKINK